MGTAHPAPPPSPKLIKKYANRRLYDTESSQYITLADLMKMTAEHIDFRVIDAKTGDDLTRSVLVQIVVEQEGNDQTAMMSVPVLRELIALYGTSPINRLFFNYLGDAMTNFFRHQKDLQRQTHELFERIAPAPMARAMSEQQIRMWKAVMNALNWSQPVERAAVPSIDLYSVAVDNRVDALPDPAVAMDEKLDDLRRQMTHLQRRIDELQNSDPRRHH